MTERKLVTIRTVKSIERIEGADFIELIKIDGWQCISKVGEFKEGDLCLYFEIDSFLPILPQYEFLRKSSYKKMLDQEGFRIKTMKMKGVLSQGLALSLNIFPITIFNQGVEDYSEVLNVIKYEKSIHVSLAGQVRGNFPSFIRKTDQERIQNIFNKVKELNYTYEVTEKLEGSSITIYFNDNYLGVCSRNMDLKEEGGDIFWSTVKKMEIDIQLKKYCQENNRNLAIQGELIGEGIQGNIYRIKGNTIKIFDIWDIDKQNYLSKEERFYILFDDMKDNLYISHAPDLCLFQLKGYEDSDYFLDMAEDKSILNENQDREGLVFKSIENPNFSFKAISNKYLLGEK